MAYVLEPTMPSVWPVSAAPCVSPARQGSTVPFDGVKRLAVPDAFVPALAGLAGAAVSLRRLHRRGQARRVIAAAAGADAATAVKEALAAKEAEYRRKRESQRGNADRSEIPALASLSKTNFVGPDGLLQVPAAERGVRASVYAIFSSGGDLEHIGVSRDAQKSLRAHFARRPMDCGDFAIYDVRKPDRSLLEAAKSAWIAESGGLPRGNDGGCEQQLWESPVEALSAGDKANLNDLTAAAADAALREVTLKAEERQVALFEERGCDEQLLFDAKLKAKGLLDLDVGAPVGLKRPAGGVGAAFAVTMRLADGSEVKLECPADITILDAAEEAGVELPSSCRSGACSACAGRVLEGIVDQSDQSYLDDDQIANGYVMTCCCYPRSDVVLETEKAAEVS